MAAVVSALGSVIGYVGAEVAEATLFERMLWPERFYNDFNPSIALQLALFMPMGGPLHRAALETLDTFQKKGLYYGERRGVMLGSAFMHQIEAKYFCRSDERAKDSAKEPRNGLWFEVMRTVWSLQSRTSKAKQQSKSDAEKGGAGPKRSLASQRTTQEVRYLVLRSESIHNEESEKRTTIREDTLGWKTVAGLLTTELSAVVAAVLAKIVANSTWLLLYLLIPLFLKLLSLLSVRREQLVLIEGEKGSTTRQDTSSTLASSVSGVSKQPGVMTGDATDSGNMPEVELYELEDPDYGFTLVEAPPAIILQFFRHYGHPIRQNKLDRFRELVGIALVYAFVLYFPAGLLALAWMDDTMQYVWLGYQVYTTVSWHIARLIGHTGCGRTENSIAKALVNNQEVALRSSNGAVVFAELEVCEYKSTKEAKVAVASKLQSFKSRKLRDSTATLE